MLVQHSNSSCEAACMRGTRAQERASSAPDTAPAPARFACVLSARVTHTSSALRVDYVVVVRAWFGVGRLAPARVCCVGCSEPAWRTAGSGDHSARDQTSCHLCWHFLSVYGRTLLMPLLLSRPSSATTTCFVPGRHGQSQERLACVCSGHAQRASCAEAPQTNARLSAPTPTATTFQS